MTDPYKILGIPPSASDDEIKKAYRTLAKKYHPDNYVENENSYLSSEKMKEINEAYDEVMNQRKGKSKSYRNSGSRFSDVRIMIMKDRLEDAELILNGIPSEQKSAEWYFLKATILYRRGWLLDAYTNFARAHSMDPNNIEYRKAYEQSLRQQSGDIGGYNQTTGTRSGCSTCDVCTSLLCADCCCECMGGDFIRCC